MAAEPRVGVNVRRVRAEEWHELRDIRLRAPAHDPDAFAATAETEAAKDDARWREWADEDSSSERWATFVADDHIVGWGSSPGSPTRTSVSRPWWPMWVDPVARGRGVGTELLDTIERWLVDRGVRELRLSVTDVNAAARRLYVRRGYEPTGVTRPLR